MLYGNDIEMYELNSPNGLSSANYYVHRYSRLFLIILKWCVVAVKKTMKMVWEKQYCITSILSPSAEAEGGEEGKEEVNKMQLGKRRNDRAQYMELHDPSTLHHVWVALQEAFLIAGDDSCPL